MKVTIELNSDLMRALIKLVNNDLDTSDKCVLKELAWELAEKAGICDENGNAV